MDKRCDVEYSGSRMCSWEEIVLTDPNSILSIQESLWRRPSFITQNQYGRKMDVSSFDRSDIECNAWSIDYESYGTAVSASTTQLNIDSYASCDSVLSVACCK